MDNMSFETGKLYLRKDGQETVISEVSDIQLSLPQIEMAARQCYKTFTTGIKVIGKLTKAFVNLKALRGLLYGMNKNKRRYKNLEKARKLMRRRTV